MSSEIPPTFVDLPENEEESQSPPVSPPIISTSPPVSPPMMDLEGENIVASALINDSNSDTIKKQEDTEEDDDEIPDFDDEVPSPMSIS